MQRRRLVSSIALLALSARIEAQVPPKEITLAELQGAVVDATIIWAGSVRHSTNGVFQAENQWQWRVEIGPGTTIRTSLRREVRAEGQVGTLNYAGTNAIGRLTLNPNRDGARAAVWALQANTLTHRRVFEVGARIVRITFVRNGPHLRCTIRGSYLTESGAGNVKSKDPFRAGYVELLNMKQTSSSCRVSKAQ
jgi:hypothetical protein